MDDGTPLVSILIPCYNHGRYLGEAIDSAVRQTYPRIEVIVVDDGSTDETPVVAQSFGDRIRYFRTANQGQCAAVNYGLDRMSGDYLVNLDADNSLFPQYVERTLATLVEVGQSDVAFVYTQREIFGDVNRFSNVRDYDLSALKQKNYIDMCALIRGDVARRFKYDPAFSAAWGDYDFYLTLGQNGFHGKLLNEPLVRYRVHGATLCGAIHRQHAHLELMRQIITKHRSIYTAEEEACAMRNAEAMVMASVLKSRTEALPFAARRLALRRILEARAPAWEILRQLLYTVLPWTPRGTGK